MMSPNAGAILAGSVLRCQNHTARGDHGRPIDVAHIGVDWIKRSYSLGKDIAQQWLPPNDRY